MLARAALRKMGASRDVLTQFFRETGLRLSILPERVSGSDPSTVRLRHSAPAIIRAS
jgi:hypothetical protein